MTENKHYLAANQPEATRVSQLLVEHLSSRFRELWAEAANNVPTEVNPEEGEAEEEGDDALDWSISSHLEKVDLHE